MYVDSHAHLFFEDFRSDLGDVLARARDAGVALIVNPGTDLDTSKQSIELAETYDMVYACVGFHPHDAAKAGPAALEAIEELSAHPKVVAIGEIGLDYHYNYSAPEVQREVFRQQIGIARRRNLPVVIHSREAEADCLSIVREFFAPEDGLNGPPRGVFHCFPGGQEMAETVLGLGFYVSFPGPVTFAEKPSKPNIMAGVAARVPIGSAMLETDSPYLSPVPFRGKRNEPSRIPVIAQKLSELRSEPVAEIARGTTAAARRLFRLPS